MTGKTLDALLSEYGRAHGEDSAEAREMGRFRRFLAEWAGLKGPEAPGRGAGSGAGSLRCFHFSQYLDWYLAEKEGLPGGEVEAARAILGGLNDHLLAEGILGREEFQENRESILGREGGPPVYEEVGGGEGSAAFAGVAAESDFHVPGEYDLTASGEFVVTKVQEGILYVRREGDPREIGPVLVDRAVSGGSRVGDRVFLSLGRAGEHWNLLGLGRRHR